MIFVAIPVSKKLDELKKMANEFRIDVKPSGKNGRFMKEDFIVPIREYFLVKRYGGLDKVPEHMKLMLEIKSPMLAKRIDSLKPEVQEMVWESDEWDFEEKLNGCRCLVVKTNEGLFLYSRHNSDVDLLPINFTSKILFPDDFDLDAVKENFILDTEITSDVHRLDTVVGQYGVVTETMLQAITAIINCSNERARLIQEKEDMRFTFNFFDCIWYDGKWITNHILKERRKLGFELYNKLLDNKFNIKPVNINNTNKKQFYKSIIMSGGEGVVSKNVNSIYVPDNTRNSKGWIKVKKSVSEMMQNNRDCSDSTNSLDSLNLTDPMDVFSDTIDGFITGFELGTKGKAFEGMVKTIKISTYLKKKDGSIVEHEIAHISGLDTKMLNDMTTVIGGIPTLTPSYYGRVVEIDGSSVSSRELRLMNAVFHGFRYDKNKDDCIIDEELLYDMMI